MQPVRWYYHRLRTMSPAELAWRARQEVRDACDRLRIPLGAVPSPGKGSLRAAAEAGGFRTSDVEPGAWMRNPGDPVTSRWAERLRKRADGIAGNRLSFFHLDDVPLGDVIDWNRDHECGKAAPLRLSQTIDYRDYRQTGDAKIVWEPNRHHQLVVLGRAYRAFGEKRYADAVTRQIHSWIDANPFGYGMNWRSPLELGIRVINWAWALDLLRGQGGAPPAFDERILETVWRHLWEITRKYSRGSSANNHLVGEAAGVFVGSACFPDLPGAREWRAGSIDILSREILRQTYADGCTREQAFGYHLFVLQFFLVVGIVARRVGLDLPPQAWERIEKMLEFAGTLSEGGTPPMFGDCDDGYVLDLAGGGNDVRELLAVGAVLFDRPDFKERSGAFGEAAYWLLGPGAAASYDGLPSSGAVPVLRSRAFSEAGLYLLQRGHLNGDDRISVLFDCAELGYTNIAAHGHADVLGFTLRVSGRDVFVDPGTYDYFTYPGWRTYFRSTAAHNTVEIDGQDQSVMQGPFLWGDRAAPKLTRFETGGSGGMVAGEHDGYGRLDAPARHGRTITMDADSGEVTVSDEIRSAGEHRVRIFFHVAEDCTVSPDGRSRVRIGTGPSVVILDADPALELDIVSGGESPGAGWVSRGYHRKSRASAIIARGTTRGNATFRFRIRIAAGGSTPLAK